MQVIYTNAGKFAGPGIGSIAYQFVRGLHQRALLKRAIVAYSSDHELPKNKVVDFPWMKVVAWLARDNHPWRDLPFDRLAARYVIDCDIFHGWSHQCRRSLSRAKKLGAITFVERQNSHDRNQYDLVQAEFDRWGYSESESVRPRGMNQGLAEYEEADFVTVPSPFAYDSMIANGIHEERLFLTPYGVDVERFRPVERQSNQFRLLFTGQVCLRKGIPYLLQAWNQLELPNAELWLVGRVTPDAEAVVASLGQSPTIRIFGHVPDVVSVFERASAFVFPSIEEGSALVTYEAMAAGIPLIFTYNSGAVARDGVEGIEVPIRDVDALANAIERLYLQPDLRREMGCAGRQRAEAYTWDAAVTRLVTHYEEALKRKRRTT